MNKKTFIKSGNIIHVRDEEAVKAYNDLPVATYTVKFDEQNREFFLEVIEDFDLPAKIYGKNTNHAERVINTFNNRPGQTGVLLSGVKGAGKTLLAKQTSVLAREHGISTIVINKDWHGDEFNSFIQSITTPCIVMFDEFEKIYGWSEQRKVLTLFDGVFNSRKLMIVTTNDNREISDFMQNRPGRMYYHFKYDTLEQDFIEEFLEDRLKDKSQIADILKYTGVFSFFNFDMLNAAVEEMNRYGESLSEVLEVLNITPENKKTDTYKVELKVLDRLFTLDQNFNNFQPNNFEYILWLDSDMPEALTNDPEVKSILCGGKSSAGALTKSGANDVLSNILSDDSIKFNPSLIKEFKQTDNQFVYSTERNGMEVELFVTRNDSISEWKYNPRAF